MKLRGFTLAELLIVLGITGVVAAVILPAINGLMPDKTKINYLKVYDELNNSIKALTADSTVFPVILKNGGQDIDVSKIPLLNDTKPLKSPFKDDSKYSGDKKLCNLLAFSMGVNESCKDTSYPSTPSFTTSNGMEWWISQTKREITENKASYQTDIYVDVDSSKDSSNCMYGESNCQNPDRFKFLLAADGTLVPADPVGLHYINTRKNFLKKKFNVEGDVLASLADNLLDNDTDIIDDDGVGGGDDDDDNGGGDDDDDDNGGGDDDGYASGTPEIEYYFRPYRVFFVHYEYGGRWDEFGRAPLGLTLEAITKQKKIYAYPIKISVDVTEGNTTKTYSCTIPKGGTGCETFMIAPYYIVASWNGDVKVGNPYADINVKFTPQWNFVRYPLQDQESFYGYVGWGINILNPKPRAEDSEHEPTWRLFEQNAGIKIYPTGEGPNSSFYEIIGKGSEKSWFFSWQADWNVIFIFTN